MSNGNSGSQGLGLTSVLTVVFVVLKLVHVIDWSWWWVLSPLWIGAAISLAVLAVIAVISLIVAVVKS